MHRLSEVHIKNYKSIKDLNLKLTDYTPLVGYNNAGKSNILEAISWFLKPGKLVEENFYDKRGEDGILIRGVIDGLDKSILELLSDKNQKKIDPFVQEGSVQFERELENPGTKRHIDLNVWHPEEEKWKPNPGGIDNAIKELFPEPIFIRAMEDATEDVSKNKRSTTIGKILKELTEPIAEDNKEEIENTLGRLDDLFGADGDDRLDDLVKIDNQLGDVIKDFFPDVNLKLHIPAPTLDDIFKSGTVQVNEGGGELLRDFDSLGHGAQRAVQMALIRFLAERDKVREESSSRKFLLIEEPELYLHPQAITFLSQALKKLSKGLYQIIFATHSPIMISQKDIGVTALIRKDDDNGTYRQNTLNEAIDKVLAGKGIADKMFALENSSQLLFADSILLIEGKTEKKIIPKLFESYYDLSSFQTKVSFINLGGAPGVKNAAEILDSMGLDFKILVDLDYCFNNAIDHEYLSGTEEAFIKGVDIIQSSTDELDIELDEDWPNSPKYLKSKNYEKLVENEDFQKVIAELHSLLLDENIWIWQTGPIEVPLGLDKAANDREQFLVDLQAEEISGLVADFDQIDEFFKWTMN